MSHCYRWFLGAKVEKLCNLLGIVTHGFIPSLQEAETEAESEAEAVAGASLSLRPISGRHSEFQTSNGYIVRHSPFQKKMKPL